MSVTRKLPSVCLQGSLDAAPSPTSQMLEVVFRSLSKWSLHLKIDSKYTAIKIMSLPSLPSHNLLSLPLKDKVHISLPSCYNLSQDLVFVCLFVLHSSFRFLPLFLSLCLFVDLSVSVCLFDCGGIKEEQDWRRRGEGRRCLCVC